MANDRMQPAGEQPATASEHRKAAQQPREGVTLAALIALASEKVSARPRGSDQSENEPEHARSALKTRQLSIDAEREQRQRRDRGPTGEAARQLGAHRGDHGA